MKPVQHLPAPSDFTLFLISRLSIESGDIGPALAKLKLMVADRDSALRFRGTLSLAIDGFNEEPRELYQIPEVRRFLLKLDDAFPYWFFLASKVDDTLSFLTECLCNDSGVAQHNPLCVEIDATMFKRFMAHHFLALNALCERLDLSEDVIETITAEIEEYYVSTLADPDADSAPAP